MRGLIYMLLSDMYMLRSEFYMLDSEFYMLRSVFVHVMVSTLHAALVKICPCFGQNFAYSSLVRILPA